MPLLVPPNYGRLGREMLQGGVPILVWGHPGIPSLSHHFKHCGGCRDMELGGASHRGWFWTVRPVGRIVFLQG